MSRHDRGRRRTAGGPEEPPSPAVRPQGPAGPSPWERVRRASAAERALLPLRFFFAITFVYAGFAKILDPSFLDAADPSSIVAQLHAFARLSPLAPVVRVAEPWAIPIGILIAVAEIAIGLGALTGLAFRLAAAGGAALSVLFWLTASWTTTPYYLGPDLPYAVGWLTLALAGTSGLLVPDWVRRIGVPAPTIPALGRTGWARASALPRGDAAGPDADPARRLVLQAGVLGALALAVASMAVPVRAVRGSGGKSAADGNGPGAGGDAPTDPGAATSSSSPATGPVARETAPAGASPSASRAPRGLEVGTTANVDAKGVVRFRVPDGASGSLPAGDPAYLVKLGDGGYTAYDARCTHEGCRVDWDAQDAIFLCPCHGAAFDPNNHGEVLGGPTRTPLPELPIVIDPVTGTISLRA